MIADSFYIFNNSLAGKCSSYMQAVCLVFDERRVLVIFIRITMNALLEKRTEVMQTLLSMIEPTENERGCLSFHAFRDIEDKNSFDLILEWKTREDLEYYIRSDRFSVLLGTKSLLSEPPQIEIHTISHSEGKEAIDAIRSKRTH